MDAQPVVLPVFVYSGYPSCGAWMEVGLREARHVCVAIAWGWDP
jgi:hypothetical protein